MTSLRAFIRLLREAQTRQIIALLSLMVLASLSEGIGILLLVPLLHLIQGGDASEDNTLIQILTDGIQALGLPLTTFGLLSAFLLVVGFRNSVLYARERLGVKLQHQVVDQLRLRCFSALLAAEWRWITGGSRSDHANLLLTDVTRVGIGLTVGLSLLATLASLAAYLLAALALSWKLATLALISGGLVFMLLSGQRRRAQSLGNKLSDATQAMQSSVQESLAGIKLTKILGSEQRHLNIFEKVVKRLREQELRFTASTSLTKALFHFGGAVLLVLYLYVGLEVWHWPIPELLILVLIFSRLIPMFASAQQQYHQWLYALPALQETDKLLAECETVAEPKRPNELSHWPVHETISLKRVTVHYSDRQRPALDRVTIEFPARTTTAIMGASGAGKSTLADILMGLLLPDEGALLIDGVTLGRDSRMRWRHSVAFVPQEVFLFNDSVANNLLWGHEQANDTDLKQVLEWAAADFVFQLPQGLDTVVGDGGVRLSGGERQRLALARALLARPSLLILDEATSALDTENEARIRTAIENLHGDLTVVIIGHRLPTLEHADQVVILNEGMVTAQGTWAQVRSKTENLYSEKENKRPGQT